MSMEDLMNGLNGGFQGGAAGASAAAPSGNPWVIGGTAIAGAGLGILNANDPSKKRALRLNSRLGNQEAEMNDLSIKSEKTKQAEEEQRRRAMGQFGTMFSNYLAAMAKAKPTGAQGFQQDLGGP